jgi:hypothetical protein
MYYSACLSGNLPVFTRDTELSLVLGTAFRDIFDFDTTA